MRRLAPAIVIATSIAAGVPACAIPEKTYNGPGDPFGCYNVPLPMVVPTQVTLVGSVSVALSANKVAGATVQVFLAAAPLQEITRAVTDADGAFTIQLSTNFGRIDGFLKVAQNGYLDTYFYPAVPIGTDQIVDLRLFATDTVTALANIMQIGAIDFSRALFVITTTDCNGDQIPDASVATAPMGAQVHYFVDEAGGSVTPSPTATVTDAATGTAIAANVPANQFINIGAMVPSPSDGSTTLMLRSHMIRNPAPGAVIETEIQP